MNNKVCGHSDFFFFFKFFLFFSSCWYSCRRNVAFLCKRQHSHDVGRHLLKDTVQLPSFWAIFLDWLCLRAEAYNIREIKRRLPVGFCRSLCAEISLIFFFSLQPKPWQCLQARCARPREDETVGKGRVPRRFLCHLSSHQQEQEINPQRFYCITADLRPDLKGGHSCSWMGERGRHATASRKFSDRLACPAYRREERGGHVSAPWTCAVEMSESRQNSLLKGLAWRRSFVLQYH